MGTSPSTQPIQSISLSSIGPQLREARENRQLSLGSAAAALRLPPKIIETLEAGDFATLAPVYARGYLRNYARLLELNPEPLIEAYNQSLQRESSATNVPLPPEVGSKASKIGYLIGIALMIPAFIWLAGKAFVQPQPAEIQTVDLVPAKQDPSLAPPEATIPASVSPAPSPPATSPAPAPAPAPATNEAATIAIPPQTAPAPQTAPSAAPAEIGSGPDQLALHLPNVAWVSLTDGTGQKLAYETLPAGTEKVFKGKAPFTLRLGHFSPETKIEFNGQSFAVPKAKAGTAVKFTIK